jgi:hypothetical protein
MTSWAAFRNRGPGFSKPSAHMAINFLTRYLQTLASSTPSARGRA